SMKKGTVWTETDVRWDSWWLNQGYMPAGIMIESGQADLFLISYLGIDFLNRGERAYRLLGCELTYHGSLPRPGDTLRYDIHVDGHANQGDIRLFFFHYDCEIAGRPALSVRQGQAGFFTKKELADSAGILWKPEEQAIVADARVDAPAIACTRRSFTRGQIRAFSNGDLFSCFGEGFEYGLTHNRTPKIQSGDMLFLDRIEEFDPNGGPWKRGYLKAVTPISADDWFFTGHFKNDPCMPGTLMFEGCLQMMAFYLAAMGYTVDRDGWRFEPVPEEKYKLLCRGQVIPTSKELTYEIFVEEVHDGPIPTLYADLLCTVDGLGAFHARRMGLRLVPDWPMTSKPDLLKDYVEPKPVAVQKGFKFDYASLMACAWGKPSDAFGPMYSVFDGTRRVARLPGPPYHFMSRVTRVDGEVGRFAAGQTIEIEYDVPPDEWYFRENGARTMPFCVLLEAALQPCGWLASFVG
ncbi:MAG: 3-hydroxyacyl-[acyl-carrier-protein] dehydratase FabA, partial [Polyangiaceae bacterium]|nr:3-hydroxyacyl-[acyl-carrier-protein] dehydratase FabA [Polyangiaceae bacterium]